MQNPGPHHLHSAVLLQIRISPVIFSYLLDFWGNLSLGLSIDLTARAKEYLRIRSFDFDAVEPSSVQQKGQILFVEGSFDDVEVGRIVVFDFWIALGLFSIQSAPAFSTWGIRVAQIRFCPLCLQPNLGKIIGIRNSKGDFPAND